MDDFELLCRAKVYVDKLANGINPLTDENVSENDVVNEVKVSRCLFFVSDVLRQVLENGGSVQGGGKRRRREKFFITADELHGFEYSDTPLPVTHITERINRFINPNDMRRLYYMHIVHWLKKEGYLQDANGEFARAKYCPTLLGSQYGIIMRKKVGTKGEYYVIYYGRKAQELIVKNIENIVNLARK